MYPEAKKMPLVFDNFKTHNASAFYETSEPEEAKRLWDRFEFIFTTQPGSLPSTSLPLRSTEVEGGVAFFILFLLLL
ncbi:MAG: hypothetical protein A2W85_12585 [Bacteroidetes bacterium GWF2_41_31]|nr:MAG: hypothetical protein A2W85_12585 [Bacteroidetes bacterium GWF2_41_31]